MKVYEALAAAFVAEGTKAAFGIMGDANQYWIGAMTDLGVPIYEVRHEGAGLAMADGFARVSGEPGVCTTTSGPGTAQLATTMLVASRAQTPLIAFCGDTSRGKPNADQRLDQSRFAAGIECGFVRIDSPASAYEMVQRAFFLARTESRPIMISAPIDVQHAEFDDSETYTSSESLVSTQPTYPGPTVLAEATEIVARSERTVIIVGRGAQTSGAREAILELANKTGALLATTLLAKNWLRDSYEFHAGISGLYSTRVAIELLQEADCVIGVGASLNHYTLEHGYLYPDATFVHINSKPQVVMGDGRNADCYVQSDARVGLESLNSILDERSVTHTGYRTAEVKERLAHAMDDPRVYEIEPGTMDPRETCRVVDEMTPSDMGLILGTGHHSHFPTMLCTKERPFTVLNKHFACIGQSLTTAIGSMFATGKQPALMIEGDAAFMMHMSEFETAVRYGLPLLAVIINDEGLGMEVQKAKAKGGVDPALAIIPTPDLGAVGVALGGRGHLVRSAEELRSAISEFVAQPGPMIVDVRTSKNVVATPYRRVWYGEEDI